ncbi:MAG: hypothetical protein WAK31_27365 [Chthoniobacterales bacterium]
MLLKTIGYHLAGGLILVCLPTVLLAEDAAQTSMQVLTPFGYRDRANVHEVLPGYDLIRMPDGHFRMENPTTGDHVDFPTAVGASHSTAPSENGWISYAYWLNTTKSVVTSFTSVHEVPAAPSTYDGQTIFEFNAIEPSTYDAILQPVLQYGESTAGGGEYWAVASWYVTSSEAYYSKLAKVATGKKLTGEIKLTSHKGSDYSYSCEFEGIKASKFSMKNIAELTWVVPGSLEVYNVDQCSDLPNTSFTKFSDINVRASKKTPSISWTADDYNTTCSVQTTIVTNGGDNGAINIYY